MNKDNEGIFNYLKVSSRIATAGQPLKHEIPGILENGTEIVISLVPRGVETEVPGEQDLFEQGGLVFERIPVVWEAPKKDDFQKFLDKMAQYREKQLFIHCEANMRVSVFMALYHIIVEGWKVHDAMAGVREIWNPNEIWREFINRILSDNNIEYPNTEGEM